MRNQNKEIHRSIMKKILALVVGLLTCLAFVFTACGSNELVVYTEATFPPFEYMDGSKIVGVDVDIMNKVGEKLGKKVVFQNMDFNSALEGPATGRADAVAAGVTMDESRMEKLDFSIAYYSSVQYVIYKVGDTTEYTDLASLAGKRIGVQQDTTGHILMDENITNGSIVGATCVPYKDANTALLAMLNRSDIDVVVIDELPAKILQERNDASVSCKKLVDEKIQNEQYGIGVKKGNTELLKTINEVLQEMLDKNEIGQLVLQHSEKATA